MKVRSMVGLMPLVATTRLTARTLHRLPELAARLRWFLTNQPEYADVIGARRRRPDGRQQRLLSMVGRTSWLADAGPDARPRGVPLRRTACARSRRRTWTSRSRSTLGGRSSPSTTSRPSRRAACSAATPTGAARSGCRSNYLLIEALREFARVLRRRPAGRVPDRLRGASCSLDEIADDLSAPADLALPPDDGAAGRSTARIELFQTHPDWRDLIAFPEYFHGDNGAGLGAWHQTGWTALVADLILTLRR